MRAMILRLSALLLVCLTVLSGIPTVAADSADDIFDGILDAKRRAAQASSVQAWIDGALAASAGEAAEWYVLALSQSGDYDFSRYEAALLAYLDQHTVGAAASREKYALTLAAVGSTDPYIREVLETSIGEQGVMSYVYGLHLLTNGYTASVHTVSSVKETLLSLQHGDGGWSVMGSSGDVDVTAMTVQALAPYYGKDAAVTAAVDRALSLLSSRQSDTGEYASCGVYSAESAAQVLTALSVLGIDAAADSRFIKNGCTLFDALARYRCADGTFAHQAGGASNHAATAQVFYSMVAYRRMQSGEGSVFCFDRAKPDGAIVPSNTSGAVSTTTKPPAATTAPAKGGYKPLVSAIIVAAAGVACLVLWRRGGRHGKDMLLVLLVAAALLAAVWLTTIRPVEEHYGDAAPTADAAHTVTLSIRCDAIVDRSAAHIPDDGIVLKPTAFAVEAGDTVYDVLVAATAASRIHMETNGGYVEGIAHIYEFDHGNLSGWVYTVNGGSPAVGCADHVLSDGDEIVWVYTLALGEDL